MATRTKRQIDGALLSKGFQKANGDHDFFFFFTKEGKKSGIRTKTSHGSSGSTVASTLLATMARQCGLATREFLDLVDCPLSHGEYETIAAKRGLL